jgi:hypothetical protein
MPSPNHLYLTNGLLKKIDLKEMQQLAHVLINNHMLAFTHTCGNKHKTKLIISSFFQYQHGGFV